MHSGNWEPASILPLSKIQKRDHSCPFVTFWVNVDDGFSSLGEVDDQLFDSVGNTNTHLLIFWRKLKWGIRVVFRGVSVDKKLITQHCRGSLKTSDLHSLKNMGQDTKR
jgi:hypothetical protein